MSGKILQENYMTHKEEVKLNRFLTKLDAMRDVVLCLLSGKGTSGDGTGKDKLVFQVDKSEISDTCVKHNGTWEGKYSLHIGGGRGKWFVTDQDFEYILDEVEHNYEQKQKKLKAKQDAKEQKKSKMTWVDVFKRVVKYIQENTNYAIYLGEKDSEWKIDFKKPYEEWFEGCDDNTPVELRFSKYYMRWRSVKEFLAAPWEGHHANLQGDDSVSFLLALNHWDCKYDRLVFGCLKTMVKNLNLLVQVDFDPKTAKPVTLMKEFDRLGIGVTKKNAK